MLKIEELRNLYAFHFSLLSRLGCNASSLLTDGITGDSSFAAGERMWELVKVFNCTLLIML